MCYLEHGWLFLLQYEDGGTDGADDNGVGVLEQSIGFLERALSQSEKLQKIYDASASSRYRPFDPQNPENFPVHVKLLLGGKPYFGAEGTLGRPFAYLDGLAMALLGRAYSMLSSTDDHQQVALDYLSQCLQPRYLLVDSEYYVEAHYLAANIILKKPGLINPDYGKALAGQGANSLLHLDSAISHLKLASKSPHSAHRLTDLQFLTAQV